MSPAATESRQGTDAPRGAVPLPATPGGREDSLLLSMLTAVIWLGCLAVGIAGLALPYLRPSPAAPVPPPITAELVEVELTSDPMPPVVSTPPPPTVLPPPPLTKPAVVPAVPPMMTVAAPSPQIAFAVPIQAPARVVPVAEASFRTVETPVVVEPAPAPVPQAITFGQGEGKQPAPEYPLRARREGQEGSVGVQFIVGQDGRVVSVETSSPSAWPLLNVSVLRTVRQRWKYPAGPVRAYEVVIHFQLRK